MSLGKVTRVAQGINTAAISKKSSSMSTSTTQNVAEILKNLTPLLILREKMSTAGQKI